MSAQEASDFFAAEVLEVVPRSSCSSTSMGNRDINIQEADVGMQSATLKPFENEETTSVMGNVVAPSKRFRRICVFCGSSSGKKDVFSNEALSLGRELVSRKIDLVYGGGSIGLMGQVAQTVQSGGGHVIGVIPKALIGQELTGNTVGELIAVADMHQRKAEMARQADAFIALPGGYGTLEELVEVITWNQLGIHRKPVGLLNADGFYDTLLTFFDKQLEEEFFDNSARSIVVSAPTASELLDKLEAYTPVLRAGPKLCWEVDRRGLGYTTSPIAGRSQ